MFYLRVLETIKTKEGNKDTLQHNYGLGANYTYVGRAESYELFRVCFKEYYGRDHVADLDDTADETTKNTIGFVRCLDIGFLQPVYAEQDSYIVTEGGKTYSRLHRGIPQD